MSSQPQVFPWAVVPPEETVTVLVISPEEEDHASLRAVLPAGWRLVSAHGFGDGVAVLRNSGAAVVVTECRLGERSWLDVLGETHGDDSRPTPRLVVVSRLAEERLWAEVLNRGAYDLLLKPLHQTEVSWVINHAFLDWRREKEATASGRLGSRAGSG